MAGGRRRARRTTLACLRRGLGPAALGPAVDRLQAEADNLALVLAPGDTLDTRLLELAGQPGGPTLLRAAAAYRGNFLAGARALRAEARALREQLGLAETDAI